MEKKRFTRRSEFYDKALSLGFYGNEESGLTGKKIMSENSGKRSA